MLNNYPNIGVVVIGRNEGKRLKKCIESILKETKQIIYVDSGSTDNSVEYVKSKEVDVVNLDMSLPFSAGRARNEGFERLITQHPCLEYIQFIDGDCELVDGWFDFSLSYLINDDSCAIVAGRRRERYPEKTIYNLLCDIEWNTPIGRARFCGGDFMIRKKAFQQVNGFNPLVIAGEEPEMCYRLSENNWSIFRLDHLMTIHDADMSAFSQWWKRMVRAGHAYGQGYALHGRKINKFCRYQLIKILIWAFIFPSIIFFLTVTFNSIFLLLILVYVLQSIKISFSVNKRLKNFKNSFIYSFFIIIAKWPQLIGLSLFIYRQTRKRNLLIIEYK